MNGGGTNLKYYIYKNYVNFYNYTAHFLAISSTKNFLFNITEELRIRMSEINESLIYKIFGQCSQQKSSCEQEMSDANPFDSVNSELTPEEIEQMYGLRLERTDEESEQPMENLSTEDVGPSCQDLLPPSISGQPDNQEQIIQPQVPDAFIPEETSSTVPIEIPDAFEPTDATPTTDVGIPTDSAQSTDVALPIEVPEESSGTDTALPIEVPEQPEETTTPEPTDATQPIELPEEPEATDTAPSIEQPETSETPESPEQPPAEQPNPEQPPVEEPPSEEQPPNEQLEPEQGEVVEEPSSTADVGLPTGSEETTDNPQPTDSDQPSDGNGPTNSGEQTQTIILPNGEIQVGIANNENTPSTDDKPASPDVNGQIYDSVSSDKTSSSFEFFAPHQADEEFMNMLMSNDSETLETEMDLINKANPQITNKATNKKPIEAIGEIKVTPTGTTAVAQENEAANVRAEEHKRNLKNKTDKDAEELEGKKKQGNTENKVVAEIETEHSEEKKQKLKDKIAAAVTFLVSTPQLLFADVVNRPQYNNMTDEIKKQRSQKQRQQQKPKQPPQVKKVKKTAEEQNNQTIMYNEALSTVAAGSKNSTINLLS